MRNAILLVLIGIMVVSLLTMAAVYAIPLEPPESPQASESASEPEPYPYLLRTYQGKIAVFTDNLAQPDVVFEVYVRTLPAYDKQLLDKGIRVESFEKLNRLVEDYIS